MARLRTRLLILMTVMGACHPTSVTLPGAPVKSVSPALVSFVKVVSDKVEDVSSLAAWRRSFIHDGMSDEEKAIAVWTSAVKFRHQDYPAQEFLDISGHVHDPIKLFNVYGYAQCCCSAATIEALARYAGLTARGHSLHNHGVAEVGWGNAWHMFDAAYIDFFRKSDGSVASVDDVEAEVTSWYSGHADMLGNADALRTLRQNGGWHDGPAILARCPYYDATGEFPAHVQGWDESMVNYDGSIVDTPEFGYSEGYAVNVRLRKGERLVRNWSNEGHHVNQRGGVACVALKDTPGQGDMRYSPAYGDLAPGRVGNGQHTYELPLADPDMLGSALVADNLVQSARGPQPPLAVADGTRPATLIIDLPSSYVYLGATLTLEAVVGAGGSVTPFISDNNGLDWHQLPAVAQSGAQTIDLSDVVFRRYDYRLKLVLGGAGTGLSKLSLAEEVQHSQRALPALAEGDNTISFSTGPAEGTVTIEAATDPAVAGQALTYRNFHPTLVNMADAPLAISGDQGSITYAIDTPGDLKRLRMGGFYRAVDARDAWDFRVSFDDGQSFVEVAEVHGPTAGDTRYFTLADVPPGARHALVQFAGTRKQRTVLFDFRIDADYVEPSGGFQPVQVTYEWDENGQARKDVHVARQPNETYTIHCATKPVMKALTVELAL
jgi:hypothetical protein